MIFYSRISNMTFLSVGGRKTLHKRHPVTGDILETIPRLDVSFGQLGPEQIVQTPDGEHLSADIRGHYFDTIAAQAQYGWDDETREMVERHLLKKCDEMPDYISLHTDPPAVAPWPTYDTMTNYLEIASFAEKLGLLDQALRYEKQNKSRDGVVKALSEKLNDQADADALVAV